MVDALSAAVPLFHFASLCRWSAGRDVVHWGRCAGARAALGRVVGVVLGGEAAGDAPPLRWRYAMGGALRAGWYREVSRKL